MSSSSAGKFQDHYSLLGVDPKANSETIQNNYSKLAQKYHPDNPDTGDAEKFESVNLAYEVLSDPLLRREFDKLKGLDQEGAVKFSGLSFFTDLGRSVDLRMALLCVLYDRRRNRPFTPSLSLRQVESMLEATSEEMTFALWYLKQRGLVLVDDKSSLQITVEGSDLLETTRPAAEQVMPLIKPEMTAAPKKQLKETFAGGGTVLTALNNAVSRR
jgi:hypothetical protein